MATVGDLVADALLEINVLAAGETLSADDGASGLRALNRMVNAWKAERVFIFKLGRTTWNIVAADGEYTVGSGADVNVLRPVHINAVNIIDTSITPNYEMPLRLMTDQDWAGLALKTLTSARPDSAYYNLTYPTGTLNLWPVPTSATLQGVLYAPEAVAEFAALAEGVALPPGYERMVVKNLAIEMAPQYGREPSETLKKQARDSLAVVLRANKKLEEMRFPPDAAMSRGSYDIWSDSP